jgi:3-hydroxybutyryl-CoA dehydrogenase
MSIPERVGVLGGGRMGAGVAHAFLLAGAEVVVVERSAELAAAARSRIHHNMAESARRGTLHHQAKDLQAQLVIDTDVDAFAGCDLVIEAVPEDLALKLDALRRVEDAIEPGTPLATNTSSISIDTLAEELARPDAFLGLHFFNPVPSSQLIEVVVGERTDSALVERASGWVTALGKTPIVVRNSPGFASSRLGALLAVEAIRMLEDGVASADDIDNAMVLGYRHPIGPLRLTDMVGLDVRLGIVEYLHAELGDRYEPPALLRRLVAEGKLGRKTGEGFFVWEDEPR